MIKKFPAFAKVTGLLFVVLLPNLLTVFYGIDQYGLLKPIFALVFVFLLYMLVLSFMGLRKGLMLTSLTLFLAPFVLIHLYLYHRLPSLGIVAAAMQFNWSEMLELISDYGVWLVVWLVVVVLFYWLVSKIPSDFKIGRKLKWCLTSLFMLLNGFMFIREVLISRQVRNSETIAAALVDGKDQYLLKFEKMYPLDVVSKAFQVKKMFGKLEKRSEQLKNFRFNVTPNGASSEPAICVLVIGESARSDHFGINQYARNTTPGLKEHAVVSYPNAYSNANLTSLSIPLILTRATADQKERFYEEKSLISLFKEAGYKTYWVSNQESIHSEVNFIAQEADSVIDMRNRFDFQGNYDGDVIAVFHDLLAEPVKQKLIVLHTMGSHFRYNYRYPKSFERFKPVISDNDYRTVLIRENKEALINSYDNSILYTDHVLSGIIDELKQTKSQATFTYFSDHGESLYEEDLILHGTPQLPMEQLHIPMIFWFSEQFDSTKAGLVKGNHEKSVSGDVVFHTIPDLWDIKFPQLNRGLSLVDSGYQSFNSLTILNVENQVVQKELK